MSDEFSTSGTNSQLKLVTSDTLGERLRQFRKECKLSQGAFGESLNVSLATITRLERDKVQAQGDFLAKLAEIYDCDLRWLLTGHEIEKDPLTVVRNDRIYSMLQAQRADWVRIVECTISSAEDGSVEQKQEAEDSIKAELEGIAYLDELLKIGQNAD